MTHRFMALLTAGVLLAGCAPDEQADAEMPDEATGMADEAALTELTEYYQTHYNMHHGDMVADVYAEEAVFTPANGMVLLGRQAVAGYLNEGMAAMSPELSANEAENMIVGDFGISRGNYEVTGEADGEATGFSGAYLIVTERDGDAWKIMHQQSNFSSDEQVAALWTGVADDFESPEPAGTMTALAEGYMTHYNLGHAEMVADYFTDDAVVSFSGDGWISGRDAIVAALQEGMDQGGPQLTVHDMRTVALGDGMSLDGGWYELSVDGEQIGHGTYSMIAEEGADGEHKIKWFVATGSPMPTG